MFVPHQKQNPSSNSPQKLTDEYITFIKNNHSMIEKHFMNDFEHPYKQSLLKSYGVKEGGNSQKEYKSVKSYSSPVQREQTQQHVNSLFTLQQGTQPISPAPHSSSLKLNQSTNLSTLSRKHQIINSLNFTKPSYNITNQPIISKQFGPVHRYQKQPKTSHISKDEIMQLIEEKNKEISKQLLKERNNFSEIVYRAKHHSQSNMVKANGNGEAAKTSIERDDIGSREMRSLQKLKKQENIIGQKYTLKDAEMESGQPKFQRYSNGKYAPQYFSQSQLGNSALGQSKDNTKDPSGNSLLFPSIKNKSLAFKQQLPHTSQYDILSQIHSKQLKANMYPVANSQLRQTQANNLSASINQLRKQFQQNSDAIKLYKKVEKNNIALKVRQINQKNLKSYYEYENAIIKNHQYCMIEDEQRKNAMTMKDLKHSTGPKVKNMFSEGAENEVDNEDEVQHKMSEEEMFIKEIIADRKKENLKEFVRSNLSSHKKQKRYQPSPAELEEELTGRHDDQYQSVEGNRQAYQLDPTNQLSQRNSSTLSPSKLRKSQSKPQSLSVMPAPTKAESTIYDNKVRSYRQFAFKIYFAHKKFYPLVIRQLPTTFMRPEQKFKFYVGKGNNSLLIKSLMKRRFWWTLEEDPKKANFVWTQLKINSLYEYQRKSEVKNLYYKTEAIPVESSPDLKKIKKKKDMNLDQVKQKKTFIFKAPLPEDDDMKVFTEYDKRMFSKFATAYNELTNPEKLDNFEKRLGYFPQGYLDPVIPEEEKKQSDTNNQDHGFSAKSSQLTFLQSTRMHNHFEFNHFIGNKKALFYNLRYYYQLINKDVYEIIPLTFHIRNGVKDPQYAKFLKYYKAIEKKGHSKQKGQKTEQGETKQKKEKNIWIIKPGENSNRGNGIQVFDELYELNNILKKKDTNKDKTNQPHTYIVQKYIQKPLLYKNRKFDIRHYFLLTRMWGKMRAYFFGEGYIRTASYQFDLGNVGDTEIHLTNDAIQKHCDSYGKYQEGNKLSYVEFQRYLDGLAKEQQSKSYGKKSQTEKKPISFANDIYPQMRSIAIQAIRACYIQMDPNKTEHNFEVFGMDFMIDRDYKVWLIEINTNPCLELSSKLLERVIPNMVEQSLRLTIDTIFPPPYHYPNTMKHMMPDYSPEKLKCELIFDEDRDGKQLQQIFQKQLEIDKKEGRKSIREMLLGQIDEEDETYENDGKQIGIGDKGGIEVDE